MEAIPPAWQHPDVCEARIELEGQACASPGFGETAWMHHAVIRAQDAAIGQITVCYTREMPVADQGPFLKEEVKLLKTLNKKLKIGSKIVFLDYDKFFDVIPNIEWLSKDEEIKKIFDKAGFKVNVVRKQGIAWQYLYIFGKKYKNVK